MKQRLTSIAAASFGVVAVGLVWCAAPSRAADEPKADAPKTDTPKTDAPKTDAPAAEAPQNLALNKPAKASSEESDEHAAAKAFDGDNDTRWCASGPDAAQWLQVDLGKPSDVTGIDIRWEMDGKQYQYVVEGSADGDTWKPLSDQSKSTDKNQVQTLKLDAPATGIRYVRVRTTSLDEGAWASIFEMKVMGKN